MCAKLTVNATTGIDRKPDAAESFRKCSRDEIRRRERYWNRDEVLALGAIAIGWSTPSERPRIGRTSKTKRAPAADAIRSLLIQRGGGGMSQSKKARIVAKHQKDPGGTISKDIVGDGTVMLAVRSHGEQSGRCTPLAGLPRASLGARACD